MFRTCSALVTLFAQIVRSTLPVFIDYCLIQRCRVYLCFSKRLPSGLASVSQSFIAARNFGKFGGQILYGSAKKTDASAKGCKFCGFCRPLLFVVSGVGRKPARRESNVASLQFLFRYRKQQARSLVDENIPRIVSLLISVTTACAFYHVLR